MAPLAPPGRLHRRWIAVGAAAMVALALATHLVIVVVAGGAGPAVSRSWAGAYLVGLALAFVGGGAIVGAFSRGNTIKESAAAGGAAVFALAAVSLVAGRGRGIEAILLACAAGLLLAVVGGMLGEWLARGRAGRDR